MCFTSNVELIYVMCSSWMILKGNNNKERNVQIELSFDNEQRARRSSLSDGFSTVWSIFRLRKAPSADNFALLAAAVIVKGECVWRTQKSLSRSSME